MKTILVVEDMAVFREPIAFCLRGKGYAAVCAGNGAEALTVLKSQQVDLILLDIGMPVMDGLTFLKAMSATLAGPKPPVILLTAIAEKDYVIQAAKFGVRDYLLKSRFSLKELLARVSERLEETKPVTAPASKSPAPTVSEAHEKPPAEQARTAEEALASSLGPADPSDALVASAHSSHSDGKSDVPRLLTGDKCLLRIQSAMAQMRLSPVASKLVALATSSGGGPSDLVSLISRDRKLSARIVQAANSVLAAPGRDMQTLGAAVDGFGYSAVRDMATTFAIFDTMPPPAAGWAHTAGWWQHSLAVAALCKRLLNSNHNGTEGAAYLAGLTHDLGEILFRTHFGDEYRQVLEFHSRTGKNRDELERAMLGITRGQMTQMILQDIGLPDPVRRSIAMFYGETAGKRAAGNEPLARVLRLADAYACGLGLTPAEGSAISCFTRAYCRNATGDENPTPPEEVAFHARVSSILALLTDARTEKRAAAKAEGRPMIRLARDPALSSFDPISAALGSLANLSVSERLPEMQTDGSPDAKSELEEHQAIVVLSRNNASPGFSTADVARLRTGGPLPILWLTERSDSASSDEPGTESIAWPVTMERLITFVQKAAGPVTTREVA